MTKQEFETKLEALKVKMDEAVAMDVFNAIDREINNLVDSYRAKKDNSESNEANRLALEIAG